MLKKLLTLSAISTLALSSHAAETKKGITVTGKGILQSRQFNINNAVNSKSKKLSQYSTTLIGSVDLYGRVTIHALLQTGKGYNKGFNTVLNKGKKVTDTDLALKRLYVELSPSEKLKIELGSYGPRKSIANAGKLSNTGWLDGIRSTYQTEEGSITVTAGQLDPSVANAFQRLGNFKANYFEISMNSKVFENLLLEAGIEVSKGTMYLNAAAEQKFQTATGDIIRLVGDIVAAQGTKGVKLGVGAKNILATFMSNPQINVMAMYTYTSKSFGERGNITNTIFAGNTGHALVLTASYNIKSVKGLSVFAQAKFTKHSNQNRYIGGIKYAFNTGSKTFLNEDELSE